MQPFWDQAYEIKPVGHSKVWVSETIGMMEANNCNWLGAQRAGGMMTFSTVLHPACLAHAIYLYTWMPQWIGPLTGGAIMVANPLPLWGGYHLCMRHNLTPEASHNVIKRAQWPIVWAMARSVISTSHWAPGVPQVSQKHLACTLVGGVLHVRPAHINLLTAPGEERSGPNSLWRVLLEISLPRSRRCKSQVGLGGQSFHVWNKGWQSSVRNVA